MSALIDTNRQLLAQARRLLERITDDAYAEPCEACFASTPGGHFRHLLEHYEAFVRGYPSGRVAYHDRRRGSPLEGSRQVALGTVEAVDAALAALPREDLVRPLVLVSDGTGADEDVPSLVARELEFLSSHTVHHFGLVRTILHLAGHRDFPDGFGLAPSTLRHRRELIESN